MQYIDGQTLAERIGKCPQPPRDVVDIGMQVAQALEAAHAAGIIHRDIKPQKIITTPRGQVKVLDFGLAKITQPDSEASDATTLERLTEVGVILGTPGDTSPEQLYGKVLDARSEYSRSASRSTNARPAHPHSKRGRRSKCPSGS